MNAGGEGQVFAMGQEEAIADPTVILGTFLLDNLFTYIFHMIAGTQRSSVSHKFKNLLEQTPQSLNKTFIVVIIEID